MIKGILFVLIVVFGAFLRFYQLGDIPNSLNWDEVSWGYNAYSILQTGRDEHGVVFPLSFQAFGDYKQPMYVYLQIPGIALFGLTSFAVRFPSALLGSLTIISVYFLTYVLFRKQKNVTQVALLAMAFFALSPWSIQFSRVAFEANVALFFVISGASFFLWGLSEKKVWMTVIGIVLFSLSGYTYHSAKVFTPLLFAGFLGYAYLFCKTKPKVLVLFFILFILGNSIWLIDSRTTARGRSVIFTSQQTQILENSVEKIELDQERKDTSGVLMHNRRFVYAEKYVQNYLKHFDPNYLFVLGDNPRHHAPGMGVLYITLLPFILLGILYLLYKRIYAAWILFYWALLAPLASALAVDAPNASRSLAFLPTWDIFAAMGVTAFFSSLHKEWIKKAAIGVISVILTVNALYYIHNYFTHTNREFGTYWQYGYKEAIEFTKQFPAKRVVFLQDVEQAYIFYLFHTEYDPKQYLSAGGSQRIYQKCFNIGNTYFGNCRLQKGDIVVSTKDSAGGNGGKVLQNIMHFDNTLAVRIVEY